MPKHSEKPQGAMRGGGKKSGGSSVAFRSAITGQFLSSGAAKQAAKTHIAEHVRRSKGDTANTVEAQIAEFTVEQRMRAAGIADITPENADEQFGIVLDALDRIARKAKDTADELAERRKLIDAGLERIDERADEIDRMLADLARA